MGFQRQLHAQRGFVTHHAVAVAVVVVVDLYYIITEEEEEEVSDREEEEEEEEGEESEMCAARDNDGRNRGRAAAELLGGTVGGVLQVSNLKL